MKVVNSGNKKTIFLQDGEEIVVKTLYRSNTKISIVCKDETLYVEDIIEKRIRQINLEQEQLEKLKKK